MVVNHDIVQHLLADVLVLNADDIVVDVGIEVAWLQGEGWLQLFHIIEQTVQFQVGDRDDVGGKREGYQRYKQGQDDHGADDLAGRQTTGPHRSQFVLFSESSHGKEGGQQNRDGERQYNQRDGSIRKNFRNRISIKPFAKEIVLVTGQKL